MSSSRQSSAGRSRAIINDRLFATGSFKNVWRGTYTHGPRAGQPCVAKEFRPDVEFDKDPFAEELNVISRAQKIISSWYAAHIIDARIILNTPEIWEYAGTRRKTLVEPFIQGYEKFNSNTGWAPVTGTLWGDAMQALSHYSYHATGGRFVLCDLQGGAYKDG